MESKLSRYIIFFIAIFAITIIVDHYEGKWLNIQITQWVKRGVTELDTKPLFSTTQDELTSPSSTLLENTETKKYTMEQHSSTCSSAELSPLEQLKRRESLDDNLIFSWTDENGVTHFSNTLYGANKDVRVLDEYKANLRPFVLNISSNQQLPNQFETQVTIGIKKIYHILSLYMEKQHLREVSVNLTFAHSKKDYQIIQQAKAPALTQSQGFYTSNGNFAAVWFRNEEQAKSTAIHEATHVINSGLFGVSPKWLNEGLAEYFERMNIFGLAVKVSPRDWRKFPEVIQMRLSRLLAENPRDWQGKSQSSMYLASHSIVHFLMSSPKGKVIIKKLFVHLAENRCAKTNIRGVLNQYPNGISALEREWRQWMLDEKYRVQSF